VTENVNYADPVFPPDVQVEYRDDKPDVDAVEDMSVWPFDDNDDGGVGA